MIDTSRFYERSLRKAYGAGILAAVLFGLSAPLAKLLLRGSEPLVLAGLLYLGSGVGLVVYSTALRAVRGLSGPGGAQPGREERSHQRARWSGGEVALLVGAILSGGLAGPVLMLTGLDRLSASTGSLLLNLEAPFTILLAVWFFREHMGARLALSSAFVVAGASLLAWQPGGEAARSSGEWRSGLTGVLFLAGACLSWALDNNLTQRLSLRNPVSIARLKGLSAGTLALFLAWRFGQHLPAGREVLQALVLGAFSYGLSLVLHIQALRHIGAARQAALFATAPFVGAVVAIPLFREQFGVGRLLAAVLMGVGVALLVREKHSHEHTHEVLEHTHEHEHEEHHLHEHLLSEHGGGLGLREEHSEVTGRHTHRHAHEALRHEHPHGPDLHHRHGHSRAVEGSGEGEEPEPPTSPPSTDPAR